MSSASKQSNASLNRCDFSCFQNCTWESCRSEWLVRQQKNLGRRIY